MTVDERVTPRTEAGRRLLKLHREERTWPSTRNDPNAGADGHIHYCVLCHARERRYPCATVSLALAIEAEAVAAREADLAAALKGLRPDYMTGSSINPSDWYVEGFNEALAAVLRLIWGEAGTE